MRKYYLSFILLMGQLSVGPQVFAEVGKKIVSDYSKKPGVIKFDSRLKNFGSVERGEVLSHDFLFTNVGKGDLKIQGVHSSCGCAATEIDQGKVYAPGEKGTLRVKFNTANFSGKLSKSLTIMTNQRSRSLRVLRLKVNVRNYISVNPPLVDFDEMHSDLVSHRRIHIKSLNKKELKVLGAKHSDKMDVQLSDDNKGGWFADIYLKPQEPGDMKEVIFLKTSLPSLPKVAVPLVGKVKGKIGYSPSYLEFGAVRKKRFRKKTLKLDGKSDFKVLDVQVNMEVNGEEVDGMDFLSVKFDDKSKNEHKMAIKIENPKKLKGSVYGDIEFLTDHPNHKKIKLDFFAFFKN